MYAHKGRQLISLVIFLSFITSSVFGFENIYPPKTEIEKNEYCLKTDKGTVYLSGTFNRNTGKPIRVTGGFEGIKVDDISSREAYFSFINNHYDYFGIKSTELKVLRSDEKHGIGYFTAKQMINNRVVLNSRITIRTGEDGSVILWGSDIYSQKAPVWQPAISLNEAAEIARKTSESPDADLAEAEEFWFLSDNILTAAYKITLFNRGKPEAPVAIINARDGEIISLYDRIYHAEISGQISGFMYPSNLYDTPEFRPFCSLSINLNDLDGNLLRSGYTNDEGQYLFDNLENGDYITEMLLETSYIHIQDSQLDMMTHPMQNLNSFMAEHTVRAPETMDYIWNPENGNVTSTASSVFYHLSTHRNWWYNLDPELLFVSSDLYVFADQTDPMFADNAGFMPAMQEFQIPNMIMLGIGSENHNNFGTFAEIVYHEYNHGVTLELLDDDQQNAELMGMHEGFSDYFAATRINRPEVGLGFFVDDPETPLRSLENNLSFPEDIENESHHDGLILGAALWEIREELGAETVDPIFHFARYGSPLSFEEYLTEVLIQDDDNNDLSDGTPNSNIIRMYFAAHGIGEYENNISGNKGTTVIPRSTSLSNLYPNPFNPDSRISFYLPLKTSVDLSVYDVLGRKVKEIINQDMTAGSHFATLKLENSPSGVYFIKLQTSTAVRVQKALFIK